LILLEPHGCEVLTTGVNNVQIFVHGAPSDASLGIDPGGGRITVDSDGKPASGDISCNGSNTVVDVNGSDPNRIEAFNSTDNLSPDNAFVPVAPGVIEVFAIQPPSTTCTAVNLACKLSQISPPGIAMVNAQTAAGGFGVPSSQEQRITRAPFDNTFNCQASYPNYLGLSEVPINLDPNTCAPGVKPPYINDLVTAIDAGSSAPVAGTLPASGTWTVLSGGQCNNNGSGTTNYSAGNYYVNCPTFSIGTNATVNFNNGNVVFQGSIDDAGVLTINNNPTRVASSGYATSTSPCQTKVTGCMDDFSPNAAFVYMRPNGGNTSCGGGAHTFFCVSGTSTLKNVMLFMKDPTVYGSPVACGIYPSNDSCTSDDGQFGVKTGAAVTNNTAPLTGPFKNLAIWNESSLVQTLQGQGGANLDGVFFFPTAQVNYSGQGCSVPTNAQFVARRLNAVGNGCLNMKPTPGRTVNIPVFGPLLIR
jgi:hypothetical protein